MLYQEHTTPWKQPYLLIGGYAVDIYGCRYRVVLSTYSFENDTIQTRWESLIGLQG